MISVAGLLSRPNFPVCTVNEGSDDETSEPPKTRLEDLLSSSNSPENQTYPVRHSKLKIKVTSPTRKSNATRTRTSTTQRMGTAAPRTRKSRLSKTRAQSVNGPVGDKRKAKVEVTKFTASKHKKEAFPKMLPPQGFSMSALGTSLLTKELIEDRGGYDGFPGRSHGRSTTNKIISLKVFFIESDIQDPMVVEVEHTLTSDHVIDKILKQHREDRPEHPLLGTTAQDYDLRMVDEDDGTPDLDFPPLQRDRQLFQFRIEQCALCLSEEYTHRFSVVDDPRQRAVSVGMELLNQYMNPARRASGQFFVKVRMPKFESHIITLTPGMVLFDLLPILAKKKKDPEISPQHYDFYYMDAQQPLPMDLGVTDLKIDEIKLVRKNFFQETKLIVDMSEFQFTEETASVYTEYKVVKTNRKGHKQKRMLGLDRSHIYNKTRDGVMSGVQSVKRASRRIKDIIEVKPVEEDALSFRISFREDKRTVTSEYTAKDELKAMEIKAKIKYLRAMENAKDDII